MSLRDKLTIWASLTGLLLAFLLYLHFIATTKHRQSLDWTIDRWRRDYHLTESQARSIRRIEESFHGSGNPLIQRSHSEEEAREHHREMADVVDQTERDRFIRMLEGVPVE